MDVASSSLGSVSQRIEWTEHWTEPHSVHIREISFLLLVCCCCPLCHNCSGPYLILITEWRMRNDIVDRCYYFTVIVKVRMYLDVEKTNNNNNNTNGRSS